MLPGSQPYITPADLTQYLPASALALATSDQQMQACVDATEVIDGCLRGRYGNGAGQPFIVNAVGNDIKRYTAAIAVFFLMDGPIGWSSNAGSDSNIKENYYRVTGWPDKPGTGVMYQIEKQSLHPDVTPQVAIGQNPLADIPQVFTAQQRGWTHRLGPQRVG
jgi:Protein of unknown function (DUF1320)